MGKTDARGVWRPSEKDIHAAQVTELARVLGVPDYPALRELSLRDPARYWDHANRVLGIRWLREPEGYVDLARGPELPSWFPGASLNWVDTVLTPPGPEGGDQTAVVAETEDGAVRAVTRSELAAQVRSVAGGLQKQGLRRGDRIGLIMQNGIEATVTFLAVSYLGAIVVPLFSGFGTDAITARLTDAGARMLVATRGFRRRGTWVDVAAAVNEAVARLPQIEHVIWLDVAGAPDAGVSDAGSASDSSAVHTSEWRDLCVAEPIPAAAAMDPMDPFMVIYTSGTTGRPKGAVHTHGGFPLKIAHDSMVHFDVRPGDVLCWPADMGWIAGSLVMCAALLRGATLVTYDGTPDFPDWSRMSQLVQRHRITHLGSAPTLIRGLAAHEREATGGDTSSVRLLITAGEGIDPEHFRWFAERFCAPGAPMINYTGGTEVSGALLSSVPVLPITPAAFNSASPAVAVDVVDGTGTSVTDEVGELAIRAPFVGMTASFWNDPDRYLDTYWSTHEGVWVHGDLAIRRSTGDFVMVGRSDDTIKVAGKRLGPAEVEEAVLQLEAVSEAAAIGVDDPVKGQSVAVFVIPAPEFHGAPDVLAADVRQAVQSQVGRAFRPSAVLVVAELPKTRSSKIMRRVIRDVYAGRPLGDMASLDNPSALDAIEAVRP